MPATPNQWQAGVDAAHCLRGRQCTLELILAHGGDAHRQRIGSKRPQVAQGIVLKLFVYNLHILNVGVQRCGQEQKSQRRNRFHRPTARLIGRLV